jgi:hypothetical protein
MQEFRSIGDIDRPCAAKENRASGERGMIAASDASQEDVGCTIQYRRRLPESAVAGAHEKFQRTLEFARLSENVSKKMCHCGGCLTNFQCLQY